MPYNPGWNGPCRKGYARSNAIIRVQRHGLKTSQSRTLKQSNRQNVNTTIEQLVVTREFSTVCVFYDGLDISAASRFLDSFTFSTPNHATMSVVQDGPPNLKRDHNEFLSEGQGTKSKFEDVYRPPTGDRACTLRDGHPELAMPTPPTSIGTQKRDTSPARSSTGSLSDARSTTPSLPSNSPTPFGTAQAVQASSGIAAPPPKKVKFTPEEREMRHINKLIKDQERAEEKARKEAERLALAEEKARKEAEKEAERKKRESEREEKKAAQEAEKAVREEKRKMKEEEKRQRDEEKRQKDEEKRQKEEEKRRADEEKRRKDRSQMKLNSFFIQKTSGGDRTSMSPAPTNPAGTAVASPAPQTPKKPETSYYNHAFPAFFIQAHVTVAPINRFERGEETSANQQRIIDSYILENRSPGRRRPFDAISLFNLPAIGIRGKKCVPVREIMAEMSNSRSRPIDLTTDSQNSQIRRTEDLLSKVPLKFLKFVEDVRPPYRGTYTSKPVHGVARLARNPLRRDLPDTNYDYDSEAEWVEDEDAEDLNSEGEEDDAEVEDVDDMDGFLDDENDELLTSKRQVLQGDLEPISTGLCWEDQRGKSTNATIMQYRMETILGTAHLPTCIAKILTGLIDPNLRSIDPFSSKYWEPVPSKVTTMDPPRLPLNALKSSSLCNNGSSSTSSTSKPVKPFFAPTTRTSNFTIEIPAFRPPPVVSKGKEKRLIPKEDWASFKEEIQGSNLSKVGLIEVLKKKFPKATGGMVKATLEMVAQRVGKKESDKRWVVNGDQM